MKVLLTGGAGYIGAHTCVELIEAGHEAVVVDNYVNSCPEAMARVKALTHADFPVYEADLCDKDALTRIFQEQKIDAVIHFAGLKAVGESVAKPLSYFRNNLDATLTLLEVMNEFGVKKLVFSSSATVYTAPDEVRALNEDAPTGGCSNPYGWTKFMIEQILNSVAASDPDWSIILLRYFNPVGAHESGKIGEDPNGIPNNLIPRVMQALVGKISGDISVYGRDWPTSDGTCIRDYIHVVDLAKGHIAALKYLEKMHGSEAINLGTGEGYSVLQILNAFAKANGLKVDYAFGPRRPGDVAGFYADASKAERLLGWRAEKSLDEMCHDSWRWQTMNPNGYGV
jgi:UDP-glucose 4-epimerase